MAREVNKYLEQLLQVFWLRPETALWRTFDCLYMDKYADIHGKSADLGCGDGVMSYIMSGGKINDYDVFSDVTGLDKYNTGEDIFNCMTEQTLCLDNSQVKYNYSFGLDHKDGLINKAKRFTPFYEETLVYDLNSNLPSETSRLDSAFSNILYWLDDPVKILSNWNSKLNKNGKLMLFVPGKKFKEKAWLYYKAPHKGSHKYLNYFDRSYGHLIKHCYSTSMWSEIFENAGFSISTHRPYLTDSVMEIWNVGTRPIAPLLINMANNLDKSYRDEAREEWKDYFSKFLTPIIEGEFDRNPEETETAFHFFVLEKK